MARIVKERALSKELMEKAADAHTRRGEQSGEGVQGRRDASTRRPAR